MQSARWYAHRFATMSSGELRWRITAKLRSLIDWPLCRFRRKPVDPARILDPRRPLLRRTALGPHVSRPSTLSLPHDAQADLLAKAEQIATGVLNLFGTKYEYTLPINWNFEPQAKRHTSLRYAGTIDYRDHRRVGDCKLVWEPNRHQHLVTLAQAYFVSGDDRFAQAAWSQWESWVKQCPYGAGMNWRSPLELAIRLINWTWMCELTATSIAATQARVAAMTQAAWRHLWEIQRNYSQFSSANNHLIGEAAGVFIGTSYFAGLKDATAWRKKSRAILLEQIIAQTYPDGGTREQAFGYHLFVFEFFALAALVARNCNDEFPPEYWLRLHAMCKLLANVTQAGPLPMIGDADDGFVLDLGGRTDAVNQCLCLGAMLFDDNYLARIAKKTNPSAYWLLGPDAQNRFTQLHALRGSDRLSSTALDCGYVLLQSGYACSPRSASVILDCGPLGLEPLAAHGHADALAVLLRIGGKDVLIDPGTYDYFTHPAWRAYLRSSRAHNTVTVDGESSSQMAGPFMWNHRADARLIRWQPSADGGLAVAEHDGYKALPDPVQHKRTVILNGPCELHVIDELLAHDRHAYEWNWHFAEGCIVRSVLANQFLVELDGVQIDLQLPEELDAFVVCGSEHPCRGWVSRGYHQKEPVYTIVARCVTRGTKRAETRFHIRHIANTNIHWSDITSAPIPKIQHRTAVQNI